MFLSSSKIYFTLDWTFSMVCHLSLYTVSGKFHDPFPFAASLLSPHISVAIIAHFWLSSNTLPLSLLNTISFNLCLLAALRTAARTPWSADISSHSSGRDHIVSARRFRTHLLDGVLDPASRPGIRLSNRVRNYLFSLPWLLWCFCGLCLPSSLFRKWHAHHPWIYVWHLVSKALLLKALVISLT